MKKIVGYVIFIALVIGGLNSIRNTKGCVDLYVDYGSLNNNKTVLECIDVVGKTTALELLKSSGYKVEGTEKYGDAVVCRLNGLPNKSQESCKLMPPEEAFWAVIIKKKSSVPLFTNEWGWAQKGINELQVSNGDSLGIVFSVNGELQWP